MNSSNDTAPSNSQLNSNSAPQPSAPIASSDPSPVGKIRQLVARARSLSRVKTSLPAFFNPIFRKQGPVNSLLMEALDEMGDYVDSLHRHLEQNDRVLQILTVQAERNDELMQNVGLLRDMVQSHTPALNALDQRNASHELEMAELNQRILVTEKQSATRLAHAEKLLVQMEAAWRKETALLRSELSATEEKNTAALTERMTSLESAQARSEAAAKAIADFVREAQEQQTVEFRRLAATGEELRGETAAAVTALGAQFQNTVNLTDRVAQLESAVVTHDFRLQDEAKSLEALRKFDSFRADLFAALHRAGEDERAQAVKVVANSASDEARDRFSRFYIDFENRFRGSREDVRKKQLVHVARLQETAARIGIAPEQMAVRDLGCGRGEWLELVLEAGFRGVIGIDFSSVMVAECCGRGLVALQFDSLAYLRQQKEGTIHFISAFHLIEHLTLEDRFELYHEVLRVLAPGGTALFETPNPENLIVAACNFYLDPTHIRPLVPESEAFALRHIGFKDVSIERLAPFETHHHATAPATDLTVQFNHFFYGPRDYALVCVK